jgi:hypothetical protein
VTKAALAGGQSPTKWGKAAADAATAAGGSIAERVLAADDAAKMVAMADGKSLDKAEEVAARVAMRLTELENDHPRVGQADQTAPGHG